VREIAANFCGVTVEHFEPAMVLEAFSDATGPSRHWMSNVGYTTINAAPGGNQEAALRKDATSYLAMR
jgi:hypothetical protein